MEQYRVSARRRSRARQKQLAERFTLAWETARRAAAMLRDDFGADRIAIFGSLLHLDLFHSRSDVDLAVWGLPEKDYFRAVGRLQSLEPSIPVDLIEFQNASQSLQERIIEESQQL